MEAIFLASISIIIPVFNVENDIELCLISIINQTLKDIQIIIIDDGSTDSSGQKCDQYANMDFRIEVFHIPHSGVSKARNYGLHIVNSPYLMFVDADDELENIALEHLFNEARRTNPDFLICGYKKVIYRNGEILSSHLIKCKPFSGEMKEFLNNIEEYLEVPLLQSACWKLFSSSIVQANSIEFKEYMDFGEDALFVYKYLEYSNTIVAIDENLYIYKVKNLRSLSKVFKADKYNINLVLIESIRKLFQFNNIKQKEEFFNNMICNSYTSFIGGLWNDGNKFSSEIREGYINDANGKLQTLNSFLALKDSSLQNRLLALLISKKNIKRIDQYFFLKEFIRKRFSNTYACLKYLVKN